MIALSGRLSGLVFQLISGIAKLRVAGAERRAFASWAGHLSEQKQIGVNARRIANHFAVFNSAFPILCSMAIYCTVASLKAQGSLSTGEFVAFSAAFGQFMNTALALGSALLTVLSVVPLWERSRPILETVPEGGAANTEPGELSGAIEISRVSFRYRPDTPLVLRDLSLRIESGQFAAIVGASGSGKSTLLRLLLGFETPESGAVYYDGQDLAGIDLQSLRRQIGVVLQTGKLLSGDIFSNIIGSAPLSLDDAWEAARLAGLEEDIRQMPMGMHTMISNGGGGLSGGQRQRLMIARAIVKKPRILLFDEATSALDNRTQEIVSESLDRLKATRLVIAHRLTTIMGADRIFVLESGRVVQCGTYAELIGKTGLFAQLAKRQLA